MNRELEALEQEERERAERGEPVVVDGCLDLCPAGEGDEE